MIVFPLISKNSGDDINNQDDSEIQAQNELFQNLPSREATRSAHGPVAVRRQLSRRSLKRPDTQLDENNHDIIDRVSLGGTPPPPDRSTLEMIDVEEDYENVEESESMERIKAIPAPMAHKRSMK